MNTPIRPEQVAPAAASYELAIQVPAGSEMVYTAGIVGTRPDGTIVDDVGEQAAEAWRTVGALLAEAGFGPGDVVSYITYVVHGNDLDAVMEARDAFFAGHRAASTLISVAALVQPQWKVEISVVAAKGA